MFSKNRMTIISIPFIKDYNFGKLNEYDVDFVELRLDYAVDDIDVGFLEKLLNKLGGKEIIFTIRDVNEGGKEQIEPDRKIALYRLFANDWQEYVDCELDFYLKYKPDLNPKRLILSKHINKLLAKATEADVVRQAFVDTIEEMKNIEAYCHKVVMSIDDYQELDYYFNFQSASAVPLIIQGSGYLGKLYRILRIIRKDEGHYLCLNDHKTASEQLSYEEYRLYSQSYEKAGTDKIDELKDVYLGGLIGGAAVYDSLGLAYYNRLFAKKRLPAKYLPFPVVDEKSFFSWVKKMNDKYRFYGFSVTMPLKKRMGSYFKIEERPVNLILMTSSQLPFRVEDSFLNTDRDAFLLSFERLKVTNKERIFIFGYGGTAETALQCFVDYENIYISGRDNEKAKALASKHDRKFVAIEDVRRQSYDVLINCTPIGMGGENLLTILKGISFRKVVDLPVSQVATPLIKFCQKNEIEYIDGVSFWQMQAKRQESAFCENIAKLKDKKR